MSLLDKVLAYWPVLTGGVFFLALGLWLRLSAARAAERKPKSLEWVRNYRSSSFPFRNEIFGTPKLQWAALLVVLFFAALVSYGAILAPGMDSTHFLKTVFGTRYVILRILVYTLGAGAVFFLLETLSDSPWAAMPAALIFAASQIHGHAVSCFLAAGLFLLLLYLRQERMDFAGELPYLGACLLFAPMITLLPGMIWLAVCFVAAHWWKLFHYYRTGSCSGRNLIWAAVAAVVVWILVIVLAAALHWFLLMQFRLSGFLSGLKPSELRSGIAFILRESVLCFRIPRLGMAAELLLDAPLLGFGFWGLFSAWTLGVRRRNARGIFVLSVCAALGLFWLVTGRYQLTLPLAMAASCVLADAELGNKRWICIVMAATGVCWYLLLEIGAWSIPLTEGVRYRLR